MGTLTERQKAFVQEYLKTNDPVEAVRIAYPGTQPKNQRRMAAYVMASRSVRTAIAEQRGEQEVLTRPFLLEHLQDVIEKGKNDMARVRAIELAAEIAGIVQPASRKKGRFVPVPRKPAINKEKLLERLRAYEKEHPPIES